MSRITCGTARGRRRGLNLDQLDQLLSRGHELGIRYQPDDPECYGWILVRRDRPDTSHSTWLTRGNDPKFLAQQARILERPFTVRLLELLRSVHDAGDYEDNDDYRKYEWHHFKNLEDVTEFLGSLGHTIHELKWQRDIDAP